MEQDSLSSVKSNKKERVTYIIIINQREFCFQNQRILKHFYTVIPFMDGNGRMGRLWQSLILCRLYPVFEYLPVENRVYQNQQNYYEAIRQSTKATD